MRTTPIVVTIVKPDLAIGGWSSDRSAGLSLTIPLPIGSGMLGDPRPIGLPIDQHKATDRIDDPRRPRPLR
jgi:hypothetical protein